jgi:hypothetical protein
MSAPSDPKELDPDAIDSAWDETLDSAFEGAEVEVIIERPARERMPTLHDDDPLRHDIGYRKERDPTRDSRPTLPVIDPLKYDVEPESEQAGGDGSGVRRRLR